MSTKSTPKTTFLAPDDRWLSPNEAAQHVGLHHQTIRKLIYSGRLPGYKFAPRTIRVKQSDVDALGQRVESLAVEA